MPKTIIEHLNQIGTYLFSFAVVHPWKQCNPISQPNIFQFYDVEFDFCSFTQILWMLGHILQRTVVYELKFHFE